MKTVDVVESALLGLLIEHLLGAGIVQSVQCWQQPPVCSGDFLVQSEEMSDE